MIAYLSHAIIKCSNCTAYKFYKVDLLFVQGQTS